MALIVDIKVIPSAGKKSWKLDRSGILKCYLQSPAERGLANEELITRLAHALHIDKKNIQILSGLTYRTKKIKIEGAVSFDQLLAALGLERQLKLDD